MSVLLVAGETVVIGREARIPEGVLHVHASGRSLEGPFEAYLFGFRPVASIKYINAQGGVAHLGDVIPGEYMLLGLAGHSSVVSIDGPKLDVNVGEHNLRIRSAGGGTFTLLTRAASSLPVQVRDGFGRSAPAGGELEFGPLPAGPYILRELRSGAEWTVEVAESRVLDVP